MQQTRRLSWAAFSLTFANVIVMVLNAVSGIYIARSFSSSQYGEVVYFMGIYLMATLLCGFGLTDQAMRDLAELKALDQRERLNQSFYTLLAIRLGTGALLTAALGVYALLLGSSTPLLIGVCAAVSMLSDFLTGALRGVQRIGGLIAVLCVQSILYLGLLLVIPLRSVEQIFVLFCGSLVLTALLGATLLCGAKLGLPGRRSLSRSYARSSGGGAAQLYIVTLLQTAYSSVGTLILGAFGLYAATGLLSVSLTVARMLPLILGPTIVSMFYPQLRACLARQNYAAAAHIFELFFRAALLATIGGTVLLIVYPDTAIQLLYTAKYLDAAPALLVLAPTSLLMVVDLFFTWTLIAHQAVRQAIILLMARLVVLTLGAGGAVLLGGDLAPLTLAGAYLLSSCVGIGLQRRALRTLAAYKLHLLELSVVLALALGLALLCRFGLPSLGVASIAYFGNSVATAVLYSAALAGYFYRARMSTTLSHKSAMSTKSHQP
jgi:O-antigen/teichoic acid export membrane protein